MTEKEYEIISKALSDTRSRLIKSFDEFNASLKLMSEIGNEDVVSCAYCGGFGEHLMITIGEHDNIEDVKCPKWQEEEAEDEGETLSDMSRGN